MSGAGRGLYVDCTIGEADDSGRGSQGLLFPGQEEGILIHNAARMVWRPGQSRVAVQERDFGRGQRVRQTHTREQLQKCASIQARSPGAEVLSPNRRGDDGVCSRNRRSRPWERACPVPLTIVAEAVRWAALFPQLSPIP